MYCQGNSCEFIREGGFELSGKIPPCIVVSRKQTSHKVEWRTRFILVFTPDTFYDKTVTSHLSGLGTAGNKVEEQAARSRIKLSRDGVLDTCTKTTGKSSGSQVISVRFITLSPALTPITKAAENSSQITAAHLKEVVRF